MKKLLFLTLLFGSFLSIAQQPLEHKKKFYVDPKTNKLYWPEDVGMYLFAADNPEGKNATRLESEASEQYTNPMYLDTENKNYIRSKWAVDKNTKKLASPQQEILFEVYRDGIAPNTNISFDQKPYIKDGKNFYGQETILSITSTDLASGLEQIYYSLDQKEYAIYNEEIAITTEGAHTLSYYAVDNVGNVEKVRTYDFSIDKTKPTTKLVVSGDLYKSDLVSTKNKFTLNANDELSGVKNTYYEIDGVKKTYYKTFSLYGLKDGSHTLNYYSTDKVGNKEETSTFKFDVDNTPPEVDIYVVGDQYQNRGRIYISSRSNIEIKAEDDIAGVKEIVYSVDGGDSQKYTGPFPLKKSAGEHIISFWAVDNLGNGADGKISDKYAKRKGLDLDLKPPVISHTFLGSKISRGDTTYISKNTKIKLSAKDNIGISKIGYKLDGKAGIGYDAPFLVTEEGMHSIKYYATDIVNNRNIMDFGFYVDSKGPNISHDFNAAKIGSITLNRRSSDLPVYAAGTKLSIEAADDEVTVEDLFISLNGKSFVPYIKEITLTVKGQNNFVLKAIDELGNESITEKFEFYID